MTWDKDIAASVWRATDHPKLYALHETNHVLCYEQVTWASGITHPDAWIMPVRPGQETDGAQTGETCSAPALATPLVETAP